MFEEKFRNEGTENNLLDICLFLEVQVECDLFGHPLLSEVSPVSRNQDIKKLVFIIMAS